MEITSNSQKNEIEKGDTLKVTVVYKDGKVVEQLHKVIGKRNGKNGTRIHTDQGASDIDFEGTLTPHSFVVSKKWELVK